MRATDTFATESLKRISSAAGVAVVLYCFFYITLNPQTYFETAS